ncbi:MAG: GNAT family N-acetyltransferase [Kiloniellales bacterium]
MRVQEYGPAWQAKVVALANRVLGKGFFEKPSEIALDLNCYVLICTTDEDQVAGFAIGRLLPKDGLQSFLEHRLVDLPDDLEKADAEGALGVIQTVVVAPEVQGQGIGTKLLQIMHDTIVGRGADKLIVTFKRGTRAANVDRFMERLGFAFWMRLESYWKQRCDLGEFLCTDRGETCSCEAVFYRKQVF